MSLNNVQRGDTQPQVHPLNHHQEVWAVQRTIRHLLYHLQYRHSPQTLRTMRIGTARRPTRNLDSQRDAVLRWRTGA